jgi:Undecaprenyl-phosphate glucose phosphotransferase
MLFLKTIATCAIAFGLLMLLAFGFKFIGGVSRLWLMASGASTCLWLLVVRLLFRHRLETMLRSGYCLDRALLLCGSMPSGYSARDAVERESRGQIRVTAIAPIPGLAGAPALGFIESAIRSGSIDHVFVAGFDKHFAETNILLGRLAQLAVDVTLLPNFQGVRAPSLRAARIGMLPAVDVACRPLTQVQSFIKRTEDLVLGCIILLLAAPAMLLIALAIKLDSRGPVFFRQTRLGFHDKAFKVWKFRTMRPDADGGPVLRQTSRDDDRVTRIGRILRRTSLDELPQLFNVIGGEMSIVGPRPHAQTMTTAGLPLHAVLDVYASRHRIKPGITGWAQVNGCRGEVTTEAKLRERVTLDCYYIENWSIALDAWIIFRTIGLALFDQDAY